MVDYAQLATVSVFAVNNAADTTFISTPMPPLRGPNDEGI